MRSRTTVASAPGKPLKIVEIDAVSPKKDEVLIKVTYTGVCHTDAFTLSGDDPEGVFPVVLGHEGAGVVVKVGEGVTSAKPSDRVIPLYTAEHGRCELYHSDKANLYIATRETQGKGLMSDGITRFSCSGQPPYHHMRYSTFSKYTVVAGVSLVKINPGANHEHICLLGCGVTTGTDAAHSIAKVQPGDSVTVFGLSAIGLAVVQGTRQAKAGRITVISTNPKRLELARRLGTTDCTNPNNYDKLIKDALLDINRWGIDYALECIGSVNVTRAVLESAYHDWGQLAIIGVAGPGQGISTRPFQLATGRVWKGFVFGDVKGRSQLPGMAEDAVKDDIDLEPFVTRIMNLDGIDGAFGLMHEGKSIRTVIRY